MTVHPCIVQLFQWSNFWRKGNLQTTHPSHVIINSNIEKIYSKFFTYLFLVSNLIYFIELWNRLPTFSGIFFSFPPSCPSTLPSLSFLLAFVTYFFLLISSIFSFYPSWKGLSINLDEMYHGEDDSRPSSCFFLYFTFPEDWFSKFILSNLGGFYPRGRDINFRNILYIKLYSTVFIHFAFL